MQTSKKGRFSKALLTGGASEAGRAISKASKNKNSGRIFRGVLSGGISEASRKSTNKYFDELESYDADNEGYDTQEPSSGKRFDHTNVTDRAIESFLGQEPIRNKMIQYVRMFGYEPSNDSKTLAGQISFIKDELKKQYAKERMKNFVSKSDWDRYVRSGEFNRDAVVGVEEIENKKGFMGFDDSETESFVPLVAGAVVGVAKNKKVQAVIGKVGTGVKKLVQKKKLQKKAIAEQNAKADSATLTSKAIQAGVPAATIKQIEKPEVLREITRVFQDSSEKSTTDQSGNSVRPKKTDNTKMYYIGGAIVAVVVLLVILKK